MTPLSDLLRNGAAPAWLFIPSAILLGALHGLEPGHSKTMMAAFIVAVRGTVFQAVLLGIAATISHTMIVWAIALGGLYLFKGLDAETSEPYFQLVSAVVIIGIASWMFWRTWQDQQAAKRHKAEVDAYEKKRGSGAIAQTVDTGHGFMEVAITSEKPARFRLTTISGDKWLADDLKVTIERRDGSKKAYAFLDKDGYAESAETVAEPYDFTARLSLDHGDHEHDYDLSFSTRSPAIAQTVDTGHGFMEIAIPSAKPGHFRLTTISGDTWLADDLKVTIERPSGETKTFAFADKDGYAQSTEAVAEPYDFMARLSLDHGDHEHDYDVSFLQSAQGSDPLHRQEKGLEVSTGEYMDAHELSHANDIRKRFAGRDVSTGQIVLFGLTGGLIPCPAAVTVLLLCVQLKQFVLGAALVMCFSIGLALTLVAVGVVAAISLRQAEKRVSWLSAVAGRAPYFSSVLIILVGLYTGWHGWTGLQALKSGAPQAALTQTLVADLR